jgi:cytochrome c oxidase assembly protein subunit 15
LILDKGSRLSTDHLNANWLLICAAMVFLMATIGAVTRLTESGLSIAEWKPVTGALPPLNAAQWQAEFEVYKATPQYQQVNKGMELGDFKKIYFWEWLHRLWGRLIGLVFALPLAFFWVTRRVADDYKWKYVGLLALGGLQGVVGWWMVESGLIHNPAVSHYRLATHLALALTLGALMFWMALTLLRRDGALVTRPIASTPALRAHGRIAFGFLCITIIWGAFVAGLDAGLIYNEWPMMGGHFMPSEMWFLKPAILNLFENHAAVQFTHRWLAFTTFVLVLSFAWRVRSPILATAVLLQLGLGILTLLSHVVVPLAALHQAGAMVTLAALLYELHRVVLNAGRLGPAQTL